MKPASTSTPHSWADLLCSRCQDRVLREHHVPHVIRRGKPDELACRACRDNIAAAAAQSAGLLQVCFPVQERQGSVIHEAGHAVAAEHLGIRVERLQLHTAQQADDTGAAARTRLEQGTADPVDYATVLLAGQEAHLHWLHHTRTPSPTELLEAILGGERDHTALEHALHHASAEPAVFWRQSLHHAQRLVQQHHTAITAVARELEDTGYLAGETLRRLLDAARQPGRAASRMSSTTS